MIPNKPKILVIDDEPDMQAFIQRALEKEYRLVPAYDGEEALVKLSEEKPDIVLTDILMPKMTGYEFYQALRGKIGSGGDVPVIIMSAREKMKDLFENWSIAEFLPKPFQMEELRKMVQRILEEKKRRESVILARDPGEYRNVVICGVDQTLLRKIKDSLQAQYCRVSIALDEKDVFELAMTLQPDFVFCQFWEDVKILDAVKAQKLMQSSGDTKSIRFLVFCTDVLVNDAAQHFRKSQIYLYQEANDLLQAIRTYVDGLPVKLKGNK